MTEGRTRLVYLCKKKADLKNATGNDTSDFVKKTNLINWILINKKM